MRITVDIADPVLEEVRREQERQGKSLRETIAELLAEGLAMRCAVSARHLRVKARHSPCDPADRACATSSALGAS